MTKAKVPLQTHEEFVFHVRDPSLSYHFGYQLNRKLLDLGPFDETQSLTFTAECIWPDRFKGLTAQATIWPEPALVDKELLNEDDVLLKAFGFIRSTKSALEVSIYLPPEACWRLAKAMSAGLVRSMLTNGRTETKAMNRVTSVSFRGMDFDPVDYVG